MGLLGTSDFMGLPRKCLQQRNMVEMFSEVGMLFSPPQHLNVIFLSQSPNLATLAVPLVRRVGGQF